MAKIVFLSKSDVKEILANTDIKGEENIETIKYTMDDYCKDCIDLSKCEYIKEQLISKGLLEFEIYQLLDNPPKTLLCLQLVVEEMEERYSEEELNDILALFL